MYQPILPWAGYLFSIQRQVFWLADFLPVPSHNHYGSSGMRTGVSSVHSGGDRAGFSPCLPYSPVKNISYRAPFGLSFQSVPSCPNPKDNRKKELFLSYPIPYSLSTKLPHNSSIPIFPCFPLSIQKAPNQKRKFYRKKHFSPIRTKNAFTKISGSSSPLQKREPHFLIFILNRLFQTFDDSG